MVGGAHVAGIARGHETVAVVSGMARVERRVWASAVAGRRARGVEGRGVRLGLGWAETEDGVRSRSVSSRRSVVVVVVVRGAKTLPERRVSEGRHVARVGWCCGGRRASKGGRGWCQPTTRRLHKTTAKKKKRKKKKRKEIREKRKDETKNKDSG